MITLKRAWKEMCSTIYKENVDGNRQTSCYFHNYLSAFEQTALKSYIAPPPCFIQGTSAWMTSIRSPLTKNTSYTVFLEEMGKQANQSEATSEHPKHSHQKLHSIIEFWKERSPSTNHPPNSHRQEWRNKRYLMQI